MKFESSNELYTDNKDNYTNIKITKVIPNILVIK